MRKPSRKKKMSSIREAVWKCYKFGHFASKCRTKSIHANEVETDDDVSNNQETSGKFFIGAISSGNHQDEIYTTLEINQVPIKFKLDTGSQVNIITNNVFKKLNSILSKTNVKLTSYSGDSIPIAGKCALPYKEQQLECFVTYANQPSVLGYKSCCKLGLIKVTMATDKNSDRFFPCGYISKCLHKIRMFEATILHSH